MLISIYFLMVSIVFASDFSPINDPRYVPKSHEDQTVLSTVGFPLAPIINPSSTVEFLASIRPPSRTSPPLHQRHYRSPITDTSPRWLVSSSSLAEADHSMPVIFADLTNGDARKSLTEAVQASSPSVEFLVHKADSFNGYQNYQPVGKAAFSALFPAPFDPILLALTIRAVVNDPVIEQNFIVLSLLNQENGFFELTLFTTIDLNNYELLDRVLHVFCRYQGISTLHPKSAQELVLNRIKLIQSLARRNAHSSGSPVSARINHTWTRFMGLLGNLPRSASVSPHSASVSPHSVSGSPHSLPSSNSSPRANSDSPSRVRRSPPPLTPPLRKSGPPSVINPKDLDH